MALFDQPGPLDLPGPPVPPGQPGPPVRPLSQPVPAVPPVPLSPPVPTSSASNQPSSGSQEQIAASHENIAFQPESSTSTKSNYIRRIIDFPRSTFDVLEELAKGRSIGDAIRDAIALSKWFKDIREDGARILIERNGKLREVITIKYPPDK